jgi:hypothetical protein
VSVFIQSTVLVSVFIQSTVSVSVFSALL